MLNILRCIYIYIYTYFDLNIFEISTFLNIQFETGVEVPKNRTSIYIKKGIHKTIWEKKGDIRLL